MFLVILPVDPKSHMDASGIQFAGQVLMSPARLQQLLTILRMVYVISRGGDAA